MGRDLVRTNLKRFGLFAGVSVNREFPVDAPETTNFEAVLASEQVAAGIWLIRLAREERIGGQGGFELRPAENGLERRTQLRDAARLRVAEAVIIPISMRALKLKMPVRARVLATATAGDRSSG